MIMALDNHVRKRVQQEGLQDIANYPLRFQLYLQRVFELTSTCFALCATRMRINANMLRELSSSSLPSPSA